MTRLTKLFAPAGLILAVAAALPARSARHLLLVATT